MKSQTKSDKKWTRMVVGVMLTIFGVLFVVAWPQFFDCMLLKVSSSDSTRKLLCNRPTNCHGNRANGMTTQIVAENNPIFGR